MGSILSQAGQKCYRLRKADLEKSRRTNRSSWHPTNGFPVSGVANLCEVRLFLTEKPRLLSFSQPRLRKSALNLPRDYAIPAPTRVARSELNSTEEGTA